MRLDQVTAEIRPRSDWEAVDLGFALVRRSFWRCIVVWWLAMGLPTVLAALLLWNYPAWFMLLFWWGKPAGSRMVLFELSRRLFGEEPSWRAVWRELPRAWWRRFFYRFVLARLSRWLPVMLAIEDLEGLRGKSYKQRCVQITRRGGGVVQWLYVMAEVIAAVLALAILMMLLGSIPGLKEGPWQQAVEEWDSNFPFELPLLIVRIVAGCLVAAVSLTDAFITGAGFAVYINNRTWIEGWDVELAFRRIAQRLSAAVGKVALLLLAFCLLGSTAHAAQESKSPAQIIQQVKASKDFTVHTVTERVQKQKESKHSNWSLSESFIAVVRTILTGLFYLLVAALVVALGWVIWKYRGLFQQRLAGVSIDRPKPSARVVIGMEISPDTLPADIPAAAWALWQQARHQEALALLYRGSISRVIEIGRIEIQESDTEDDCLRRVERAEEDVHPDYFRGITRSWSALAYAGISPADAEVQRLCQQWPFGQSNRKEKP